jgi:hypothetical protein
MEIAFLGRAFEDIFIDSQIGKPLYDVFEIKRPSMRVGWDKV